MFFSKNFSKIKKLNFELLNLYNKIKETQQENLIRKYHAKEMEKILENILNLNYENEFKVVQFGSTKNGLSLPNCDIDLVIIRNENKNFVQKLYEKNDLKSNAANKNDLLNETAFVEKKDRKRKSSNCPKKFMKNYSNQKMKQFDSSEEENNYSQEIQQKSREDFIEQERQKKSHEDFIEQEMQKNCREDFIEQEIFHKSYKHSENKCSEELKEIIENPASEEKVVLAGTNQFDTKTNPNKEPDLFNPSLFTFSRKNKAFEKILQPSDYVKSFNLDQTTKIVQKPSKSNHFILSYLSKSLSTLKSINPSSINYISKARTPIIKLNNHIFDFDISINNPEILKHNDFISEELERRPFLKPIIILTKYFLKIRNLDSSFKGGLCSYAQFLFILHFAKLHPVLQCANVKIENNLGVIMMDLFQFYGLVFPFNVCIDNMEVCYKKQVLSNAILSLEDPVIKNHDAGDNCSDMYSIVDAFQHAYFVMQKELWSGNSRCLLDVWIPDLGNLSEVRERIVKKHKEFLKNK